MIRRNVWGVIVLGTLSALLALPAAGLADERDGQQQGNQQGRDRDRDDDDDDRRGGPRNEATIWCSGSGGVVAISVSEWERARHLAMIARDSDDDDDDCDDDDEDNDDRRGSGGVGVRDRTCAEGSACVFFIRNRGAGVVTASFTTGNGTAIGGAACTPGIDYISATGSVVIGPNSAATAAITTCSDAVAEPNEAFVLNVTAAGATIQNLSATGRIREGGTAALLGSGNSVISISNAVCPAGDPCSFTVAQSGGSGAVNVAYTTQNGTALGAGSCPMTPSGFQDYVFSSGTVTVGANGTANIPIQSCASGSGEGPETFTVNLTGTSAGTIVVSQGVATINL